MSADHATFEVRLASGQDARCIAEMSKNLIEVGLGWSWTVERVTRSIWDRNTNVAVVCDAHRVIGFGITKFKAEEAHIVLLAVADAWRRRGVGTMLIRWIEKTALIAGVGIVYLEARLNNAGARAFYRTLGYKEFKAIPGRYKGLETGICLGKDLWVVNERD